MQKKERRLSMKINKNLMNRNHEALKRTQKDINWLVFHYVGALGDARENTEYYKNTDINASADFWVGFAGDIWQGNDYWNYYSWAIGGGLQGDGPHPYFQIAKNVNSVSVEMCVRKRSRQTMNATDKDWYFEDATVESAAELGAYLMKELDIDIDHVIRHYDVNAKVCPNPFVYDTGKISWNGFKKKIVDYYNKIPGTKANRVKKEQTETEYSVQAGVFQNQSNAQNMMALMKEKGFDAILKSKNGQYIVQCGTFSNRSNAEALVLRLKSQGISAIIN